PAPLEDFVIAYRDPSSSAPPPGPFGGGPNSSRPPGPGGPPRGPGGFGGPPGDGGGRGPPRGPRDERSNEPRVNRRIRVREVRVIGDDGTQLGILPTDEALRRA